MEIIYSDHATKRMKRRGIISLEVEFILTHSEVVHPSFEGRSIAVGHLNGRRISIVFMETESYIKIITLM
ncbi:DUF4258 domain-containing protein [Candidatus Woesearchaeota archaeon]|nr:DUF4258 domain-containing protein [Candidatus Woesearchaeota archaeon]